MDSKTYQDKSTNRCTRDCVFSESITISKVYVIHRFLIFWRFEKIKANTSIVFVSS